MNVGKLLIVLGVVLILVGVAIHFGWLGRMPGDIVWRKGNFTVYFPLGSMVLLSLLLSLLGIILRR